MSGRASTKLGPRFSSLDRRVEQKFGDIALGIGVATWQLTTGDHGAEVPVSRPEELSGGLHGLVDHTIEEQFARHPPMGSEFRYLVTLLRVVPELERSADLVDLIAERAYLSADLPPHAVDTYAEMGQLAASMWDSAGEAWAAVDGSAAARLDESDDSMDLLTSGLPSMLAREGVATRTAIEMTLVARFYERLGDHAVHIASRIRWLAAGS